MSPITTHVLDTASGRPASGVPLLLEFLDGDGRFREIARGTTDVDGRCRDLLGTGLVAPGVYRLTFDTGSYFATRAVAGFYPSVPVIFTILDGTQHFHVPLLLSPFGYSTYRGS